MNPPPPPPPPHGEVPKSSGLPPGKYDIFIIPPHSSGSGFLYLPSLQPNINSFIAGFATALIFIVIIQMMVPAAMAWWNSMKGSGGMGMLLLIMAVGLGAWAFGRTQVDGGPGPGGGPGESGTGGANSGAGPQSHTHSNGYARGPTPGANPSAQTNGFAGGPSAGQAGGERPKSTWQRSNPSGASPSGANQSSASGAAKNAWEKAREETKKREEERKAKEAEQKRREDELKRKEEQERRIREAREKEARERDFRERREREAKEKGQPPPSSYAYSAVGEKTNPWPNGPPKPSAPRSHPNSPLKRPPAPTVRTFHGTDDEAYSFRPYDTPKKPSPNKAPSSIYSESSYAASQSTSQTTPPPSNRGPYFTKDPDKIVIKAVYAFNNAFHKTPTSQLIAGVGTVTDGLILRITTEGLFIDDDVRGVPQREWDVKAWTMKLVEVWCPSFRQNATASARVASSNPAGISLRRLWGLDKEKIATSEETDALLINVLQLCRENCFSASAASDTASSIYSATSYASSDHSRSSIGTSSSSYTASSASSNVKVNIKKRRTDASPLQFQTGENKTTGLHLLRASIRDQDGKKYVFVITEDDSWKVAVGLQRLRKGTQVRALGVSGMTANDAKGTLEHLGWT